jgi:acyl homoserine lactone synthase
MIQVITYKDIERNYRLFISQFQLRHREFLERQNYDVRSMDGLEFDAYDTIATVYLVYSEDGERVLGLSRLTPIHYGCMLADHFSDLVDDKRIFQADANVWEGTRFCIDRRLPADQRQKICHHLVAAYLEFGLDLGIAQIIGLMPTIILRSVFERSGVSLTRLGAVHKVGDHAKVQAASIAVTDENWEQMRRVTGLQCVIARDQDVRHADVA